MTHVVSNTQGAFIQGKQIIDGILVANECVDSWKKSGSSSLVCKIDLEKAFDMVD